MSTRVLEFPSTVADSVDQVGGVFLAENSESFFKSALLDETVSSQIPTGRVPSDEVLL